jgi:hypothetical protein
MSNTITTKKESAEWLFVSPSLQKEQETNIFQNKTSFKIKVLTPLVAYSGPATSEAAKEDPDLLSDSGVDSVYLFKGRIMDNRMAHVSFLEDPCDISIVNSPQSEIVGSLHSNILLSNVGDFPNISVGDIVYGELDTGNSNLYNLQYVNMTSVSDIFKVEDVEKKLENCYDVKGEFESNWFGSTVGVSSGNVFSSGIYNGIKGNNIPVENGRIPKDSILVVVGQSNFYGSPMSIYMVADAEEGYRSLNEAFKKDFGVDLLVTDHYRSYEAQVQANKAKPTMTAVPGTSNHGWGLALDFDTSDQSYKKKGAVGEIANSFGSGFDSAFYRWMTQNAPIYGFENPYWALQNNGREEPWHWEWTKELVITPTGAGVDYTNQTSTPIVVDQAPSDGTNNSDGSRSVLFIDQPENVESEQSSEDASFTGFSSGFTY